LCGYLDEGLGEREGSREELGSFGEQQQAAMVKGARHFPVTRSVLSLLDTHHLFVHVFGLLQFACVV
jgi:hypothetical protein